MDNYIFVEGKKFIAAKKAALETGYTSDYIGQIAREGRVDSKKIGRVRFVNEEQIKSYTVDRDRKKVAAMKISKSMSAPDTDANSAELLPKNMESTPVPELELEPTVVPQKEPVSVPINAPSDAPAEVTEPVISERPVFTPVVAKNITKKVNTEEQKKQAQNTLNDAVKSLQGSMNGLAKTPVKLNAEDMQQKAIAVAISLMIVFSPYLFSKTGIVSELQDSFSLAYEAVVFDFEELSMEVYKKTDTDGAMRLLTDSLAYTEAQVVEGLASAFYAYSRVDDAVIALPQKISESELNLNIDVPAKTLKASALDSAEGLARGVYEWFYVRSAD